MSRTAQPPVSSRAGSSAAGREIARFAALAEEWWDPDGRFRALHRLNPVRVTYVRDRLAGHFGRAATAPRPLAGLSVIDIGCGGGLLAEPMARLGAAVTAIDADRNGVEVARAHARAVGLAIDYRCALPETVAREGGQFDAVTTMEVVEHVASLDVFMGAAAALVRPGGCMVVATINRTLRSLAFAKVAAEYVLRWVPAGTHDWRKFVRPSELGAALRRAGLDLQDVRGMTLDPLTGRWTLGGDVDVNYLVFAVKP